MQMRSCEDKLKGETAHFRLPSASQKRTCLSSLIFLERWGYVLFFEFRKARNLCQAGRTSINPRKIQLAFLIK